jgi:UPF0271 protein
MTRMDLSCDVGEAADSVSAEGLGGAAIEERLYAHVTSVSIACGGHAGDASTMKAAVERALRWNVSIGAHPSYPDRANFGRAEMDLPAEAIVDAVCEQVRALAEVAAACGARVAHVKPHGALYNQAARDAKIAGAIALGVARWRRDVVLVGLAGSLMLDVFRAEGFRVAAEAFADRRYEPDGSLRGRRFADALIGDPAEAAAQALRISRQGSAIASDGSQVTVEAQTICIHGDTPNAAEIAAAVAAALRGAGVELRALSA